MRRAVLACLALILAACAGPSVQEGFRREGAPIGSAALFEVERFLGDWEVVAEYPGLEAGCPPLVRWQAGPGGVTRSRCAGGPVALSPSGPGRFSGGGGSDIWILWVDVGYRTAVIGTPDGSFGRILNRGGPIPADRYAAALELLDFNGYDTTRLIRR